MTKQNRNKKITTIALTDAQRAAIESASDREHGRLTDGLLRILAYWERRGRPDIANGEKWPEAEVVG